MSILKQHFSLIKILNNQQTSRLGQTLFGRRFESNAADLVSKTDQITQDSAQTKQKSSSKRPVTFAKLFKESKFVSMGRLEGKDFVGKIVDVVGDDLYVDYGGKFYCICKRPEKKSE